MISNPPFIFWRKTNALKKILSFFQFCRALLCMKTISYQWIVQLDSRVVGNVFSLVGLGQNWLVKTLLFVKWTEMEPTLYGISKTNIHTAMVSENGGFFHDEHELINFCTYFILKTFFYQFYLSQILDIKIVFIKRWHEGLPLKKTPNIKKI